MKTFKIRIPVVKPRSANSYEVPLAQLVKNLPAMRETWVQSPELGRSPGEEKGYPLQYSSLENSMDYPWGRKESGMTE